jgi:hypothetical protein
VECWRTPRAATFGLSLGNPPLGRLAVLRPPSWVAELAKRLTAVPLATMAVTEALAAVWPPASLEGASRRRAPTRAPSERAKLTAAVLLGVVPPTEAVSSGLPIAWRVGADGAAHARVLTEIATSRITAKAKSPSTRPDKNASIPSPFLSAVGAAGGQGAALLTANGRSDNGVTVQDRSRASLP